MLLPPAVITNPDGVLSALPAIAGLPMSWFCQLEVCPWIVTPLLTIGINIARVAIATHRTFRTHILTPSRPGPPWRSFAPRPGDVRARPLPFRRTRDLCGDNA